MVISLHNESRSIFDIENCELTIKKKFWNENYFCEKLERKFFSQLKRN